MTTALSKSLGTVSELTLIAPIKPGFIESNDTQTYASRLRATLRTLDLLGKFAREASPERLFADKIERIRSIHSFRFVILDGGKLMLAVTFDRPWEPYIRLLWRDVGPVLDLIFCNCVGYPLAAECTFAQYAAWIRRWQTGTDFFYVAGSLTVDDQRYLKQVERHHRENAPSPDADLGAARQVLQDIQDAATRRARNELLQTIRQGLAALSAFYRLRPFYLDDSTSADGQVLRRAVRTLLEEMTDPQIWPVVEAFAPARFSPMLRWFEAPARTPTDRDGGVVRPDTTNIQTGILEPALPETHGCLLLVRAKSPTALATLFRRCTGSAVPVVATLALTPRGLETFGVSREELAAFPPEFVSGMESRAGLLGDVRSNHPGNWDLPLVNWPWGSRKTRKGERVQLGMVDLVLDLRIRHEASMGDADFMSRPAHPLRAFVDAMFGVRATDPVDDAELLAIQPMSRSFRDGRVVEHFGFVDGISQPRLAATPSARAWNDTVAPGDIFLGYANDQGDPPTEAQGSLLHKDGTFLVIRKLRQDVAALHRLLAKHPRIADKLLSKMMGRTPDGRPLLACGTAGADPGGNNFNYDSDGEGRHCPLHSHVRRANPRTRGDGPLRVPRILRRGMTYGRPYTGDPDDDGDRGLMFVCANASIAEQFEVIQGWLTGGNSSGGYSNIADPFLGVPQPGDAGMFRFEEDGAVHRVDLHDPENPAPLVRLCWGLYLFVPSLRALEELSARGRRAVAAPPGGEPATVIDVSALRRETESMAAADARDRWKAIVEDGESRLSGRSAALWRGVRAAGGVVDTGTEYGVLVGSREAVRKVLGDGSLYSVRGYGERMRRSLGLIYLGMDPGKEYEKASAAVNAAIGSVSRREAYLAAREATDRFLEECRKNAGGGPVLVDVQDLSESVLGDLCRRWFGLPDGVHLHQGGWRADPLPPSCPGHFASPSRYIFFSPCPTESAQRFGVTHGQALRAAVKAYVCEARDAGAPIHGRVARAMFRIIPDNEELASALTGVMMGFLPTTDGSLRSIAYEWVESGRLWEIRRELSSRGSRRPVSFREAQRLVLPRMIPAMQRRPVPDIVWRTATRDHELGGVVVGAGRRLVVGLISATHQELEEGWTGETTIFGGDRAQQGHPVHACPGLEMSMGAMLGMLTELLARDGLQTTAIPLVFTVA